MCVPTCFSVTSTTVAVQNVPAGEVVLHCPQMEAPFIPHPPEDIRFHAKAGETYYVETLSTPGALVPHVSCVYRDADWFNKRGHEGVSIVGHTDKVISIDYREYEEWSPK